MNSSRHIFPAALVLALLAEPAIAASAEPVPFLVRNNADLVALCTTPATDPNYVAAIHFCHGVGVGINRYHEALLEGKEFQSIYCLPDSVTRNQAIAEYVRFSKAHPEYDQDRVGDVAIKFLSDTYPCPKDGGKAKR